MAYVQSIEFILNKMREKNLSIYEILDNERNTIDEEESEEVSVEDSVKAVEENLNHLEGIIHVVLRRSPKGAKRSGGAAASKAEIYKYSIRLGNTSSSSGLGLDKSFSGSGMLQLFLKQMEENNKLQLESIKREYEHKEKLRELELKKDENKDSTKERFLNILEKMFDEGKTGKAKISDNTTKAKKQMTTGKGKKPSDEITEDVSENTERLRNALRRLNKVDSRLLEHLEMLADIGEKKKTVFKVALAEIEDLHSKL